MRRLAHVVLFSFAALGVSACDDCGNKKPAAADAGTTTTASASASVTQTSGAPFDKPCTDYANALCAKLTGCEGGAALRWRFPDEAKCKERAKLECTTRLGAPDVTFAASDMDGCVKAVNASACDALGPGALPAGCRGKGARKTGASCASDDQCESQLCDRTGIGGDRGLEAMLGGGTTDGSASDCGSCVAPAKEGDVCLNVMVGASASCARGLACDSTSDSPIKCTKPKMPAQPLARAADGEACKTDDGCIEPAVCVRGRCKVLDATACK